jgi:hypothetical protein
MACDYPRLEPSIEPNLAVLIASPPRQAAQQAGRRIIVLSCSADWTAASMYAGNHRRSV